MTIAHLYYLVVVKGHTKLTCYLPAPRGGWALPHSPCAPAVRGLAPIAVCSEMWWRCARRSFLCCWPVLSEVHVASCRMADCYGLAYFFIPSLTTLQGTAVECSISVRI